jgi:hypothetical protein
LALLLAGSMVLTPAAIAAPGPETTTTITTPSDPSFLDVLVHPGTGMTSDTLAISGTTTFDVTSVEIDCLSGRSVAVLASAVPVTGATFSTVASLQPIWGSSSRLCQLRAVPTGVDPTQDSIVNYVGPRLLVDGQFGSTVGGGANAGALYDYSLHAQQFTGAFDYHSLGGGGLDEGSLFDPYFALTTNTFFTNAALLKGQISAPTRSELRIDGADAYTPDGAKTINAAATGLPALSYTYSVAPVTGDLVIHETDPLVRCPSPTYPPTAGSCLSFLSAGVTDQRTITQDHDGHITWVSDVFTSTDGQAHSLDLLWENEQHFYGAGSSASLLEYEFPDQSGFAMHAVDDTVSLPATPGTILVRMSRVLDGDPETGQGAIIYDRPATSADFYDVDDNVSDFTLHQAGTVPAGGSARFRFAYVQDYLAANVASLAQTATTAFLNTLTVSKAGAGSGTVTSSVGAINCGSTCSAAYPYGTSVTLTATPAAGSTFTSWSGACSGAGPCTVTTDDAASVTATFGLASETLTVAKTGTGAGGGTVTSSPSGIDCGTACSGQFSYGTSVTLTATGSIHTTFEGWSGLCSGTGTCTVTMNGATSVTADFKLTGGPPISRQCVVPRLRGKTLAAARRALKARICSLGKVGHAFSRMVKKGRVISQKPKPGKRLHLHAKVSVVLSKGKR